jgi:hypothetical protein
VCVFFVVVAVGKLSVVVQGSLARVYVGVMGRALCDYFLFDHGGGPELGVCVCFRVAGHRRREMMLFLINCSGERQTGAIRASVETCHIVDIKRLIPTVPMIIGEGLGRTHTGQSASLFIQARQSRIDMKMDAFWLQREGAMEISQKTRTHGRLVIGGSSMRLCFALQAFWPADKFGTHSYLPRGAYEKLCKLLKVHPSSHREDVHRTGGISLKKAA